MSDPADAEETSEIDATIHECGNGFPAVGNYVPGDDGELYEVTAIVGPIFTGRRPGEANYLHARVVRADWRDCSEGREFPASATLLAADRSRTLRRVVVRRQAMQLDGASVFLVRGRYSAQIADVSLAIGHSSGSVAWWDLPLPPCPDCGGEMVWAEAGNVPGTRECTGCGSLFAVETIPEEGET